MASVSASRLPPPAARLTLEHLVSFTTPSMSCIAGVRRTSSQLRSGYSGGARDRGTACGRSRRDRGPTAPLAGCARHSERSTQAPPPPSHSAFAGACGGQGRIHAQCSTHGQAASPMRPVASGISVRQSPASPGGAERDRARHIRSGAETPTRSRQRAMTL